MASEIDGILQQTDVELRIAAGEAISVRLFKLETSFKLMEKIMYEIMRDYDGVDEFAGFDNHDIIVESLIDLAAGVAVGGGSVKDTAKKVNSEA